jgi:hypothetical protein
MSPTNHALGQHPDMIQSMPLLNGATGMQQKEVDASYNDNDAAGSS